MGSQPLVAHHDLGSGGILFWAATSKFPVHRLQNSKNLQIIQMAPQRPSYMLLKVLDTPKTYKVIRRRYLKSWSLCFRKCWQPELTFSNMEVRSHSPCERERRKISPGLQMQSEVKLVHMYSVTVSSIVLCMISLLLLEHRLQTNIAVLYLTNKSL